MAVIVYMLVETTVCESEKPIYHFPFLSIHLLKNHQWKNVCYPFYHPYLRWSLVLLLQLSIMNKMPSILISFRYHWLIPWQSAKAFFPPLDYIKSLIPFIYTNKILLGDFPDLPVMEWKISYVTYFFLNFVLFLVSF